MLTPMAPLKLLIKRIQDFVGNDERATLFGTGMAELIIGSDQERAAAVKRGGRGLG
jgi:hypothetical protein